MTFDFAPDWMTSLLSAPPYSSAEPRGLAPPAYPDNAAVAALVSELFAEGTLSAEQLCSLVGLPELRHHLPLALARLPSPRADKEPAP